MKGLALSIPIASSTDETTTACPIHQKTQLYLALAFSVFDFEYEIFPYSPGGIRTYDQSVNSRPLYH
jgi:hypothetical protein